MKGIEIPFGAKDSELCGWEYTIPEGMEAVVEGGKVIVRKKESEDERIRKEIVTYLRNELHNITQLTPRTNEFERWIAYLEKQKEQKRPDLPGIEESGIPGKDYIQVEWVDACEKYGKWKIVKQEQPEVDLEKEYKTWWNSIAGKINVEHIMEWYMHETARHFYDLGRNTKKQ